MVEEKKRITTTTNKVLVFIAIISWVVTLILFLSGLRHINIWLLLLILIGASILIWYFTKKPKIYDIYKLIDELSTQHYVKNKRFLDTRNFQVIQITPESSFVHLPYEGLVAYFEGIVIKGIEYNHIYRVLRRQEKSKLFSESLKYLGAESKIKQTAEALNIDLKSLGLE